MSLHQLLFYFGFCEAVEDKFACTASEDEKGLQRWQMTFD